MRIVFAPRALRDIDEILAYIQARSAPGARNVSLAIEHAIENISLVPRAGGRTDEPDLYRRALGRYRYTIFYRHFAGTGTIEIVRVVHGRRVRNLGRLPDV